MTSLTGITVQPVTADDLGISDEVLRDLQVKACWHESAVAGHRANTMTIVKAGNHWQVYKLGLFLRVMSWEGNKGTPQNVPCVPKKDYFDSLAQMQSLGMTPTSESELRQQGLSLTVPQMLEHMALSGSRLELPENVVFEAASYKALKTAIKNAGGNYSDNGFEFRDSDTATSVLTQLLSGASINIRKTLQYFPTTEIAGDALLAPVNFAGKVVFEPSAGEGALVRRALNSGARQVLCAEIYTPFHEALTASGATIIGGDVMALTKNDVESVDVILMNPPFSGGQDIKHVLHMLDIAPAGAEIHAIMSGNIQRDGQGQQHARFRELLNSANITPEPLAAGAFKASGTMVSSCIVRFPAARAGSGHGILTAAA